MEKVSKNDGASVADAARDHSISEKTIYGWLGKGAEGELTWSEVRKLKREEEELEACGWPHPVTL